jgi:O-succinylbenzoate synthase
MEIRSIDAFLLDLPLTEPFVASHGTTTSRTISVLRITTDVGVGWGECPALPAATYTAESAVGSFRALVERIAPDLIGRSINHAGLVEESIVAALDGHRELPMAASCVEMALLDAGLTAKDVSLATWLAAQITGLTSADAAATVPAGVSVGLASIPETVETCVALVDAGYRRLKVKIQPGHDRDLVAGIRNRLPDIELQVDANGAYQRADLAAVLDLTSLGVDVLEQPFTPADPEAAALLVSALADRDTSVPVVADEAVEAYDDAERLIAGKAMTGLSIKPGRVGGLLAARALHDLCVSTGVAATAGGMLETGLGRHALVALAALPGFTLTGDLSPAKRWLAADPWPDLVMAGGTLEVPTGPGVCAPPDQELLDRYTTERHTIGA